MLTRGGGGGIDASLALGIQNIHIIAVHIALGVPAQGDLTARYIAYAIPDIHHRLDGGNHLGDGARLVGIRRFGAAEAQGSRLLMAGIAVGRIGLDRQGVDLIQIQRGDGNTVHGHQGILLQNLIALAVGDGHVVSIHIALGKPAEAHITGARAQLAQVVNAVLIPVIAIDGNRRGADDRGLDIDRRVGREEQFLGVDVGHAGGPDAHLFLEQLHRRLCFAAVISGDIGVKITQFLQAPLQAGNPAVAVPAAQGNIAPVFGGTRSEQPPLQGRRGQTIDL